MVLLQCLLSAESKNMESFRWHRAGDVASMHGECMVASQEFDMGWWYLLADVLCCVKKLRQHFNQPK